ncbi:hypothetical protein GCM10011320_22710 [Neoroseomonas lacus]|uniref:Secreted protein n=1 Tax=Neoroseomonas lacus TaxID=287609 RepID=A0A917NQB1_9PROT|nr:hypothetical protein GCM10011320_22710 [Neoroseomonas lacus]
MILANVTLLAMVAACAGYAPFNGGSDWARPSSRAPGGGNPWRGGLEGKRPSGFALDRWVRPDVNAPIPRFALNRHVGPQMGLAPPLREDSRSGANSFGATATR